MESIQCRLEVNSLTTPQSYRMLFIPRNVVSTADLAARMAKALPNYSAEEFRTFINLHNQLITESLISGEQVTEENAFTYSLSFTGRLENPNDPLPPLDECLHVRVRALPALVAAVRQEGHVERLAAEKKLPLITSAQDNLLELKDVLNPAGALQLTGSDMRFDRAQPGAGECALEGTAGGRTVQSRFIKVEESEIIFMPDIPAQAHPWNNEFRVSVSTHYSEHGTLRTGTYERMLRSPLAVDAVGAETGILSGKEGSPHVSVIGATASADETLRIQVILDLRDDRLLFSLLDMQEGGRAGAAVTVTADGEHSLDGFSGSAVSRMDIRVDAYASLKSMIRSKYGGRLTDILEVRTA